MTAPSVEGAFGAALPAKPPLKGEVPAIGGRRGSFPSAAKVAAALSAAVTTTQPIGNAPNSQAEPTKKKSRKLNANRSSGEGVWGRGASLREAASPPAFPYHGSSGGGPGEGLLAKKPPPPESPTHSSSTPRHSSWGEKRRARR